jgi:ribonuclease BN (tRNA processing enzyme)
MPTGDRFQTGLVVESGDDRLLVDCGSGVLHALARTDAGYEGADAVLLTHHHLDHVADLLPLLKARWLAGEESLAVAGPPGTKALLTDLLDVHDYLRGRTELAVPARYPTPGSICGRWRPATPSSVSPTGFATPTARPRWSSRATARPSRI